MKLKNKVSIVTGGGQGIGKAICLAFAREGSDLVVADILPKTAEETSKEIKALGRRSFPFEIDVSNGKQIKEMVSKVLDSYGRIDILVNVAGIAIKSPIENVSEKDWDKVIAVNLKGTFLCSQTVGREMIKQHAGTIINFGSVAAYTPQIYLGAYSPSKAAVLLLTKMMAVEWAKHNIRVNAISPGPIVTPLTEAAWSTEALKEARAKSIPMNRFGRPEEIAKAVVFLASDESSYVTGHSLVVDGGSLNSMFHMVNLLVS